MVPLITGGCARNVDGTWKAPLVYRIDVQQGNVIDQEMIDKLKPGMDKNQVKFVMGTPLIKDPFHSNRWDYVYIMEPGRGERKQRRITLYFENNKLAYVDGDIKIGEHPVNDELTTKDRSVTVPLDAHKEGFFSHLFNKNKPSEESESAEDTETVEKNEAVTKAGTEKPVKEENLSKEQQATDTDTDTDTTTTTTTATATPLPVQKEATTEKDDKTTDNDKETIADKEQDKNLVRRFWDRITSGADDSGLAKGKEETERDIRDAEVLEKAGGGL